MFLASLCLTDGDLAALGFLSPHVRACERRRSAARVVLHRILAAEPGLAVRVADRLDLRHLDRVAQVRADDAGRLQVVLERGLHDLDGERLAGWAWALLTDPRPEMLLLGRRLMSECFVRGMQLLAAQGERTDAPTAAPAA
jgi:hypothetical protein